MPHAEYTALGETQLANLINESGLLADLKNDYADRHLPAGAERWTL